MQKIGYPMEYMLFMEQIKQFENLRQGREMFLVDLTSPYGRDY
jgi:hypothetical protein